MKAASEYYAPIEQNRNALQETRGAAGQVMREAPEAWADFMRDRFQPLAVLK